MARTLAALAIVLLIACAACAAPLVKPRCTRKLCQMFYVLDRDNNGAVDNAVCVVVVCVCVFV